MEKIIHSNFFGGIYGLKGHTTGCLNCFWKDTQPKLHYWTCISWFRARHLGPYVNVILSNLFTISTCNTFPDSEGPTQGQSLGQQSKPAIYWHQYLQNFGQCIQYITTFSLIMIFKFTTNVQLCLDVTV